MGRHFLFGGLFFCLGLAGLGCDESSSSATPDQAEGAGQAASASGKFEPNTAPAILTGTVLLEGAKSHGSTLVEAVGLGATTTAGDGSFRLSVTLPGEVIEGDGDAQGMKVTIKLTQPGYTAVEPEVRLKSGETVELDSVTLSALRGSVSGRIVLPVGLEIVDFQDLISVRLVPDGGDGIAGDFDETGAFTFSDLTVGPYRVEVSGHRSYPWAPVFCWDPVRM